MRDDTPTASAIGTGTQTSGQLSPTLSISSQPSNRHALMRVASNSSHVDAEIV